MLEREIDSEKAWMEKYCIYSPVIKGDHEDVGTMGFCYGSRCGFWATSRVEGDKVFGMCVKK